jgi:hypothetical protein
MLDSISSKESAQDLLKKTAFAKNWFNEFSQDSGIAEFRKQSL